MDLLILMWLASPSLIRLEKKFSLIVSRLLELYHKTKKQNPPTKEIALYIWNSVENFVLKKKSKKKRNKAWLIIPRKERPDRTRICDCPDKEFRFLHKLLHPSCCGLSKTSLAQQPYRQQIRAMLTSQTKGG